MKKYWFIILILIFCVIAGIALLVSKNNSSSKSNYSAQKSVFNTTQNNTSNTALYNNSNNTNTNASKTPSIIEKEISSFSTKITNKKDINRQGNITITCSALNNTIVKPGETFSFCDVVGESTPEKGYKEANVIIEGVETKGLGRRELPS